MAAQIHHWSQGTEYKENHTGLAKGDKKIVPGWFVFYLLKRLGFLCWVHIATSVSRGMPDQPGWSVFEANRLSTKTGPVNAKSCSVGESWQVKMPVHAL